MVMTLSFISRLEEQFEDIDKMELFMTQEKADKIISSSTRCTQATLRAFGIEGYPYYGSGCLEYLTSNGFTLTHMPGYIRQSMRLLEKLRMDRNYLIHTKGHAMALINGILIDTAKRGFDGRRIENIWIVEAVK